MLIFSTFALYILSRQEGGHFLGNPWMTFGNHLVFKFHVELEREVSQLLEEPSLGFIWQTGSETDGRDKNTVGEIEWDIKKNP